MHSHPGVVWKTAFQIQVPSGSKSFCCLLREEESETRIHVQTLYLGGGGNACGGGKRTEQYASNKCGAIELLSQWVTEASSHRESQGNGAKHKFRIIEPKGHGNWGSIYLLTPVSH